MNILYIDTTTADLVVAIIQDNGIVDVSCRAMGVKHSETLCNKVAEALAKATLSFFDLNAYACAVGPGSFTGIRIGVSTLKGYCTAVERPYIAVNCLQAIAVSPNCGQKGSAVIDAGNGYYYYDVQYGVSNCVISYGDERAASAGRADGACDYLDGAVKIVRDKFAGGSFDDSLSPVYIRKSQAEITLQNKVSQND